jgi:hypothetical protein
VVYFLVVYDIIFYAFYTPYYRRVTLPASLLHLGITSKFVESMKHEAPHCVIFCGSLL